MTTSFRRAGIDKGHVFVETAPDVRWYLPNPTPTGATYKPDTILKAVIAARVVNLKHWKPLKPGERPGGVSEEVEKEN